MKTDIEIAQEAEMLHIREVAQRYGITEEELELYGKYKAKLTDELWEQVKDRKDGKLVLVTAINPTPAGEGKTTTSIGLADALNRKGTKNHAGSAGAVFRTVLGAIHIEEGHFFEIQVAFVLADGLGCGGTGLVFADEGDVALFGLGFGHLGHGFDPFGVTGCVLAVQVVVAACRRQYADDAESSGDFSIAGRADFMFDRNECILPFFLGHDKFLLSSITDS